MSPVTGHMKPQWFHILLALAKGELHGSAIMEEVFERTDGAMKLWPGTLYGSLQEMADQGLITEIGPPEGAPNDRGKRRFYQITTQGRRDLAAEVARLSDIVQVARSRNVADPRGLA
jgi:DNA-binding PadR family transcriptional regulator